ncbi:uncharacterized protein LOC26528476 [Drosophila mojavensis]|uniref:Uncharacterized protein n=1 Tax=Drosophila mojavensis TaxID=7230 RepID=A0A0Q9XLQ2_DROMO|nr:uncharacterized protein LOC26528476 [Drosophila mojavensis]KRG04691.1 uncharacterized protein Dmoj_GI26835 [Drosophila mojavensis]
MSIVLDVVQKIVLYSAYELTCAAAAQVLYKCRIIKAWKFKQKFKTAKATDNRRMSIEDRDPPATLDGCNVEPRPSSQQLDSEYIDFAFKNCGPICQPKTSMMRIARDSYFS